MVVKIRNGLCHFSGTDILLSTHSTIFMAGKAIKTSITMLKTSVKTMFSIFIFRKTDEQTASLLVRLEEVLPAVNRCCPG